MARKKKHEEHENHERWLVSYADFITLLFAFFVVMYSISSVNEGKYRVLSDSISSAFDPARDGLPIKLSSPLRPPIIERDVTAQNQDPINIQNQFPEPQRGVQASLEDQQNFAKISQQVAKSLAPLIEDDQISVTNNDLWVEIEIKSSILFSSGRAALSPVAVPVLRRISGIVKDVKNQIQVEGFTDNVPIDTPEFPSNWELSAARAASVVHLFSKEGVRPSRLSAVGYGEYKPIANNDTPDGRQKNRRINIIVLSDAIARTSNRTEQLEKSLADKRRAEQQQKQQESQSGSTQGSIILLPQAREIQEAVR